MRQKDNMEKKRKGTGDDSETEREIVFGGRIKEKARERKN